MQKTIEESKDNYEQLVSRNKGILTSQEQDKLKYSKILIAGCGVGGNIAILAARMGFGHIILIDGDTVELSNINRQYFEIDEIGENKAHALAKSIKEVNPFVKVDYFPYYLDKDSCEDLVLKADIVVDTIDISALPVIISLHEAAAKQNKLVLFPLNIGWGTGLFVFTNQTISLHQMLGIKKIDSIENLSVEQLMPYWANLITTYFKDSYLFDLLNSFLDDVKIKGWCPVPQLGIASYLNASLTITAAVRGILGLPLRCAPQINLLDAHEALM